MSGGGQPHGPPPMTEVGKGGPSVRPIRDEIDKRVPALIAEIDAG